MRSTAGSRSSLSSLSERPQTKQASVDSERSREPITRDHRRLSRTDRAAASGPFSTGRRSGAERLPLLAEPTVSFQLAPLTAEPAAQPIAPGQLKSRLDRVLQPLDERINPVDAIAEKLLGVELRPAMPEVQSLEQRAREPQLLDQAVRCFVGAGINVDPDWLVRKLAQIARVDVAYPVPKVSRDRLVSVDGLAAKLSILGDPILVDRSATQMLGAVGKERVAVSRERLAPPLRRRDLRRVGCERAQTIEDGATEPERDERETSDQREVEPVRDGDVAAEPMPRSDDGVPSRPRPAVLDQSNDEQHDRREHGDAETYADLSEERRELLQEEVSDQLRLLADRRQALVPEAGAATSLELAGEVIRLQERDKRRVLVGALT